MSKFSKQLSATNKELVGRRADMLAKEVGMAAGDLVRTLERDCMSLENQIIRLTDLGPDSKDSLRPASKDFKGEAWVNELHQLRLDLRLKGIELDEAKAIVEEFFTDDKDAK